MRPRVFAILLVCILASLYLILSARVTPLVEQHLPIQSAHHNNSAESLRRTTVAMVVAGFGKLNPSSGIATAFETLAELLVSKNLEVTVVYAGGTPISPEVSSYYSGLGITLVEYVQGLIASLTRPLITTCFNNL
jgi:hypothetical protein